MTIIVFLVCLCISDFSEVSAYRRKWWTLKWNLSVPGKRSSGIFFLVGFSRMLSTGGQTICGNACAAHGAGIPQQVPEREGVLSCCWCITAWYAPSPPSFHLNPTSLSLCLFPTLCEITVTMVTWRTGSQITVVVVAIATHLRLFCGFWCVGLYTHTETEGLASKGQGVKSFWKRPMIYANKLNGLVSMPKLYRTGVLAGHVGLHEQILCRSSVFITVHWKCQYLTREASTQATSKLQQTCWHHTRSNSPTPFFPPSLSSPHVCNFEGAASMETVTVGRVRSVCERAMISPDLKTAVLLYTHTLVRAHVHTPTCVSSNHCQGRSAV